MQYKLPLLYWHRQNSWCNRGGAMGAKLRSWWQKIKQHPFIVTLIVLFIALVLLVIFGGYKLNWDWTGFNGNNKSGKTLWDWLQLLIIPLALAIIALLFQLANTRTERQIAKERYDQDQQIALDKQREDLLQGYLDRMTELLLDKDLRSSEPDAEVRNVARARTLTVLPQLDAQRKGNLVQFLSESKLLEIIILNGAQLDGAFLNFADLYGAHLDAAHLDGASLNYTNLKGAHLENAFLYGAHLDNAYLNGAYLNYAHLNGAYLNYAHLNDANLDGADLNGSYLNYADLNGAHLYGANLDGVHLRDAKVTAEQLAVAQSLKGATMPDGSIHP